MIHCYFKSLRMKEETVDILFQLVDILENCTEENNTTIEEIKDILSKVI